MFKQKEYSELVREYLAKMWSSDYEKFITPEYVRKLEDFNLSGSLISFINVLLSTKGLSRLDLDRLYALASGHELSSLDGFVAFSEIKSELSDLRDGHVVVWCGNVMVVSGLGLGSCVMRALDGTMLTNRFYLQSETFYIIGSESGSVSSTDLVFKPSEPDVGLVEAVVKESLFPLV